MPSDKTDDKQYREEVIAAVNGDATIGWTITDADGWCFGVPAGTLEPRAGDTARFYGRGIGYPVRGLEINGVTVYYRTEAEDTEYQKIQRFGATATEWLERWDKGRGVWSVSMGGLGPGYEQAIQVAAVEVLRHLLAAQYDSERWGTSSLWQEDQAAVETAVFANPVVSNLGLSGAQWGAAVSLATTLYMRGPREALDDPAIKDRLIQVSKGFPRAEAA